MSETGSDTELKQLKGEVDKIKESLLKREAEIDLLNRQMEELSNKNEELVRENSKLSSNIEELSARNNELIDQPKRYSNPTSELSKPKTATPRRNSSAPNTSSGKKITTVDLLKEAKNRGAL